MNISAYSILDNLGLPRPNTFEFDTILNSNDSKVYFLRTKHGTQIKKFLNASELKSEKDLYQKFIKDRIIIQIEDGILSNMGGCAVVYGENIYTEIVIGHLSGLLLNGWVSLRTLNQNDKFFKRMLSQTLMVKQTIEKNEVVQIDNINHSVLEQISKKVSIQLSIINSLIMLEFIIDSNLDVYYVDVKDFPFNIDFLKLFSRDTEDLLLYSKNYKVYNPSDIIDNDASIYKNDFNIENLSQINSDTIISIKDSALLSHFVTRSLKSGLRFLIK